MTAVDPINAGLTAGDPTAAWAAWSAAAEGALADACRLGEADDVAGYYGSFLGPVLRFWRRLKICMGFACAILINGFTLARSVELSHQCEKVLGHDPIDPIAQIECLGLGGPQDFHALVVTLYNQVVDFICKVDIHRERKILSLAFLGSGK